MKFVPLGDICDIQSGGTPSRSEMDYWGGDISWAKISDIEAANGVLKETEEHITVAGLKSIRNRIFKPGTLLFAMYGSLGKTAFAGVELATNQAILGISPKSEKKLDKRYLKYWLASQQARFENDARGVTQKNLSATYLRELTIPLLTLEQQKRIAAILDKADAIRRKRQQAIQLADEFLRSVFLDMFGDPRTNPKGLNSEPLGSLLKLRSGNFLPGKEMNQDGVFPVYGGNGISGYHNEYMFEEPQIVIGRVGVYCGAVHLTPPRSWITDNALYVSEVLDNLNFKYLEWALKFARLNDYASQAAQPLLSGSRIYPVEILVPDRALQNKFEDIERKFNATRRNLGELIKQGDMAFKSVSQRAFRGDL